MANKNNKESLPDPMPTTRYIETTNQAMSLNVEGVGNLSGPELEKFFQDNPLADGYSTSIITVNHN